MYTLARGQAVEIGPGTLQTYYHILRALRRAQLRGICFTQKIPHPIRCISLLTRRLVLDQSDKAWVGNAEIFLMTSVFFRRRGHWAQKKRETAPAFYFGKVSAARFGHPLWRSLELC